MHSKLTGRPSRTYLWKQRKPIHAVATDKVQLQMYIKLADTVPAKCRNQITA